MTHVDRLIELFMRLAEHAEHDSECPSVLFDDSQCSCRLAAIDAQFDEFLREIGVSK